MVFWPSAMKKHIKNTSFFIRFAKSYTFPNFWSNVRKKWKSKIEFEAQKRASRTFRWSKMNLLNMNFNMQGSKILSIVRRLPKMSNIFQFFPKFYKRMKKSFFRGGVRGAIAPPIMFIFIYIYIHISIFRDESDSDQERTSRVEFGCIQFFDIRRKS